jgi:anti-anti-sigma factor
MEQASPLEIVTTVVEGVRNVAVTGDVDASTARVFERDVLAALDGASALHLDLSTATFRDAEGVDAVVRTAKAVYTASAAARITPNEAIAPTLRREGLETLFPRMR